MLLRTVRGAVMMAMVSGRKTTEELGAAWFLLLDPDQEEKRFHLSIFSQVPILSLALACSPSCLLHPLLLQTAVTVPQYSGP